MRKKNKDNENIYIGDSGTFEKTENFSKGVIVVCSLLIAILFYLGIMLYVG